MRLSHANVVQVFDLGRVGGALFIAMEYVQGLDLATLLAWNRRRNAPVAVSVAGYVAAEVAKGLDHAHRRRDEQMRPLGIVHRDVSPQNVLLSYEGEVKVTDFGIAKARDIMGGDEDDEGVRSDGRISIRGKYAYLAPEQASGGATDARCDIFSLGIVMYEMLAGSNPFAAPTMFETLRRVRLAEHPPLELARPDVPKELAAIVARALAQKPEDRYPDAARLHDDLSPLSAPRASGSAPTRLRSAARLPGRSAPRPRWRCLRPTSRSTRTSRPGSCARRSRSPTRPTSRPPRPAPPPRPRCPPRAVGVASRAPWRSASTARSPRSCST
ncbi:MAG: serine/threonine protein kinase [Myxococcales bacterium]|nr:serine/threonine protein kinase [Myxococcales bacterium]